MIVNKNKVVSISYSLHVNAKDGELVEVVEKDKPMQYIHGTGTMLESFESQIEGLKAGDSFDFMIKSEDAYGEASDEAIVNLPKSIFEVDGVIDEDLLVVDNVIPMQDKDGNHYNGIVLEVSDDEVQIDFNHPLAGDDLFFTGNVIEIREASNTEIEHGHVHGEGHHHHH